MECRVTVATAASASPTNIMMVVPDILTALQEETRSKTSTGSSLPCSPSSRLSLCPASTAIHTAPDSSSVSRACPCRLLSFRRSRPTRGRASCATATSTPITRPTGSPLACAKRATAAQTTSSAHPAPPARTRARMAARPALTARKTPTLLLHLEAADATRAMAHFLPTYPPRARPASPPLASSVRRNRRLRRESSAPLASTALEG